MVLIVQFFGVTAMHAARSDDEGGARVCRDRKQGSDQLLISFLVRSPISALQITKATANPTLPDGFFSMPKGH